MQPTWPHSPSTATDAMNQEWSPTDLDEMAESLPSEESIFGAGMPCAKEENYASEGQQSDGKVQEVLVSDLE